MGNGAQAIVDTLCNYPWMKWVRRHAICLAVASIDEAMALEEATITNHGAAAGGECVCRPAATARSKGDQKAVDSDGLFGSAADDIARIAMNLEARAYVQVMLDTGMSRSGVCPEHLPRLMKRLSQHVSLAPVWFLHALCVLGRPRWRFQRRQPV